MTGFASVETEVAGRRYRLQAKCVNHRFFEMKMRGPREWTALEILLRQSAREALGRGSLDLQIDSLMNGDAMGAPSGDEEIGEFIERLKKAIETGKAKLGWGALGVPWLASILSRYPELWWKKGETAAPEKKIAESAAENEIQQLWKKLRVHRQAEGTRTREAVTNDLKLLRDIWQRLSTQVGDLQGQWQQHLKERLQKMAAELQIAAPEEHRIHQEFVLLCDKRDVAEELQRIDAHLKAGQELLDQGPADIGKRLDFLLQELHREWTTFGNKVNAPALSQEAGQAKLALERMREQSLNLL